MSFEFKLPDIGEGIVEGEIVRWLVKEGERLEEDQPMVEVMTDKATVEISSPVAGTVSRCFGEAGDPVKVGGVLVLIDTGGEEPPAEEAPVSPTVSMPVSAPSAPVEPVPQRSGDPTLATPAIRRLAREMEVDLSQVPGTGPGGRVSRDDLERFRKKPVAEKGVVGTLPYRGIRRRIGERMVQSVVTAPHFTYVEEIDVTELVALRDEYRKSPEFEGVRLTYLPFIIKALVIGFREYPLLNSTLNQEADVIELKQHYNIGIAAQTPDGLLVPVVKNAEGRNIKELATEIARLTEDAQKGQIKLEDLQGGTFTITSLGAMGGIMATPIINFPEVAILGVHKIAQRPVVRSGEIVIREMMNLSLSQDHRVVDGAIGAQFIQFIKPRLENPKSL
jgi:pyruvate dehydrogenase E2 component (dihydrolipoamide acetyltransferase)